MHRLILGLVVALAFVVILMEFVWFFGGMTVIKAMFADLHFIALLGGCLAVGGVLLRPNQNGGVR